MIRMSFDKYDRVIDKLSRMDYQCRDEGTYYPTIRDLTEKLRVKTKIDIEFLEWLLLTNDPPETDEEKESVKFIRHILYNNLMLVDEPSRAEIRAAKRKAMEEKNAADGTECSENNGANEDDDFEEEDEAEEN